MEHIIQAIAALLAIANPLGAAPLFSSMTEDRSKIAQRAAAVHVSLAVFLILGVASLSGGLILKAFGISLSAFQAGGGLVVLLMGMEMIRGTPTKVQHVHQPGEEPSDSIIVPLAMPLIAGPGAITTVVGLTSREPGIANRIDVLTAVAIVSVILLLTLLSAAWLSNRVGKRAHQVFLRFMGLILVAVGAQMLLAGVSTFMR